MARFAQDTAGEVAVMFGLMALAMFMMIGAAVDIGRWLNARDQTVAAVDAAVLAAGRALQTNGTSLASQNAAKALAKKYYDTAVANRLKVFSDTVAFTIPADGASVTITGNAQIVTPFMGIGGIHSLPLLKSNGADYSKAVLAVGGNAEQNLEIAMMLDTSGSMGQGSKLSDMKAAAQDLVNIVVWADQSKFTSKVAIVPFSGDVRVPASWLTLVQDPTWPSSRVKTSGSHSYTYTKTSCVAERAGTNKYTDALAAPGSYIMNAYTSNGVCSQSSTDDTMIPMTSSKTTLLAKITSLDLGGGTAGHIGTAWAYYMLSPKWAPILPLESKPVAYNTPKTTKIAILMTDGEYNFTYDNQGVPTSANGANGSANGNSSAAQAIAICNLMKQDGIDVYTIGFDLGGNSTAENTLQSCASDSSKFYTADDGEQLKQAFRDVALKISSLYLAK